MSFPNYGQDYPEPTEDVDQLGVRRLRPVDAHTQEWPEPAPLTRNPTPLPISPCGPILGPMAEAVAESVQVPTDLAINLGLPLIGCAAAGEWRIVVAPDWTETLAIATVSAAESGERKSATIAAMSRPLEDVEAELRAEMAPQIRIARERHELKADRVQALRREAVKAKGDERDMAEQAYLDAAEELAAVHVPFEPRLMASDTTPEALLRLLNENGGALGVFSAEGGFFDQLGRYTDSPQLDGVLQGISGDTIRVDRQGKDPIHIRYPTLNVGICTQPGRLAELGREERFRVSGLLARFGYALPAPRVGHRAIDTTPIPHDVAEAWRTRLQALAREAHQLREARTAVGAAGQSDTIRRELHLSTGAQATLRAFRIELEPELRASGKLATMRDWGSKAPGLAVRIAAALTLLMDPEAREITPGEMEDGVTLVRGYVEHVHAAFGALAGPDDEIVRATEVLNWLVGNGQPTTTVSDLWQSIRKRTWAKDGGRRALGGALQTLAELGHVRVDKVTPNGGGRPSDVIHLHPVHLA